ncbi:MAG: ComEC/Rec2 family competence protein [Oscillospiraceae bacterium]
MKRKFACIGFPFMFGLLAFAAGMGRYNLVFIISVLAITFAALLFLKNLRKYILISAAFSLIALSYSSLYTAFRYNKIVSYSGKEITISGYVSDYKYLGKDKGLITVKGKLPNNIKTTVSFYVPHDEFKYYDKVNVSGYVEKIEDTIDSASENYYRSQGVYIKGSQTAKVKRLKGNVNPVFKKIKEYRDYVYMKIINTVPDDEGAFLGAMMSGNKEEMTYKLKQQLYHVGIGHIFAVSGTHLIIITSLAGFLLGKLLLSKKIKFLITQIVVWSFVVFAGMSPSVIRAAVMLTVTMSAELFFRRSDCLNSLGLCALVLSIGNPYVVINPSFVLSMAGVFSLGVAAPKVLESVHIKETVNKPNSLRFIQFIFKNIFAPAVKSIVPLFVLLMITAPLSIVFFDGFSLISPLTNVILVPLCTAALCLTAVTAAVGEVSFISVPLLKLAGLLVKPVIYTANKIARFRYAYISVDSNKTALILFVICAAGILLLILFRKLSYKAVTLALVYLLMLAVNNFADLSEINKTHIVLLPGKNMCQAIVYKGENAVICDVNSRCEYDNAVNRLVSKKGITNISAVCMTDEKYYTEMRYNHFVYPAPDKCFYCEEINKIDSGFCKVSFDYTKATVSVDNVDLIVYKNSFEFNGTAYSLENENYPVDIVLYNNDIEMRRLDYEFNDA